VGDLLLILIGTSLVSNLVLDYMLGVDPVVAVSQKTEPAINLCILMLLVMPVISVFSWLLNGIILLPFDLDHLQLLVMVLMSVLVVITIANLARRFKPLLYTRIELFVPLVTVNSAVLGVALLGINYGFGLTGAFVFGLGTAAGFSLVSLVISTIRERVTAADVPAPFRGVAIIMLTLGLISMAFMGFSGISKF